MLGPAVYSLLKMRKIREILGKLSVYCDCIFFLKARLLILLRSTLPFLSWWSTLLTPFLSLLSCNCLIIAYFVVIDLQLDYSGYNSVSTGTGSQNKISRVSLKWWFLTSLLYLLNRSPSFSEKNYNSFKYYAGWGQVSGSTDFQNLREHKNHWVQSHSGVPLYTRSYPKGNPFSLWTSGMFFFF